MERKVKFGVFTDNHPDLIVGGEKRLAVFLDACREADVDFIIELGDFCKAAPVPEAQQPYLNKENYIAMYRDFEKPSYYVLGNHDMDVCDKQNALCFFGSDKPAYYSFDMGGFHFVVVDNNTYLLDGQEIEYDHANYMKEKNPNKVLCYIAKEQLEWLREDLAKTADPTILFAHNPMNSIVLDKGHPEAKANYNEFNGILNSAPGGVYMCINGHTHLDHIFRADKIWHYTINSMSNFYAGGLFAREGLLGAEMDAVFPWIKNMIPYRDPLFAIIEMDDDGALVHGRRSEFIGPTPEEIGLYTHRDYDGNQRHFPVDVTASIKDRYIKFIK